MQKQNHNKSKSFARRRETVDHSEDSLSSSPSDRHERKRVRWQQGNSAAEDSAESDSEEEIEIPKKV
jgi:hypothetical protein